MKDNKIFEIKSYLDSRRFEVKEFNDITNKIAERNDDSFYHGFATVGIQTGDPTQPVFPQALQFVFPEEITSVEAAFEKFDEYLKIEADRFFGEIERQQQEAELAKEKKKSKEIITPGNMSIPFDANFLKGLKK